MIAESVTFTAPEPIPSVLAAKREQRMKLATAFPDFKFTLDGKFIGDIGEAIAQGDYGLEKLHNGSKDHDMKNGQGLLVQVKATQKGKGSGGVGLGLDKRSFQHLLVFEFDHEGRYEVLYNGPGSFIDKAREHKISATLSRHQLRRCQGQVPLDSVLPRIR